MTEKAQAVARRKTRMALRRVKMYLPSPLPPLLALIDPGRTSDPVALASGLPNGSGLIYRHFGAPDRREVAARLAQIAKRRGLVFLIGNDPKLARETGADGVHWSQKRRSEARRWRSRFDMMTCAAHSRRAVFQARDAMCDGVLLSTVFKSKSQSASYPMGALRFRNIVRGAPSCPIYALGGVNSETIGRLGRQAGAAAIEGALIFAKSNAG